MSKGELHDYAFDVIQEEECLIWDTAITNPQKWLYDYSEDLAAWEESGTWMSRVVGKLIDTYKE